MLETLSAQLGISAGLLILLIVAGIWELVWKALALWKSARLGQPVWFIVLLVINTVGILPILYIFLFSKIKLSKKKKK